MVELTILNTITAEIYYRSCWQIDRHNSCHQESLDIEKSWVLKIGQIDSTYMCFRWMWSISGWHTKSSLGRHRPKLIFIVIFMNRWYITPTIGSWWGVQRGGGGILLTLMTKPWMMTTHCLGRSMVLPDVELLYMGPLLRRWQRRGMGHKLNTCFKTSARSNRRIWNMYVRIVRTLMRSKMKCGSVTLRQTVPILHSLCIAHMNFSAKK